MDSFLEDLYGALGTWRTGAWFVGFVPLLGCLDAFTFDHRQLWFVGLLIELFYLGFAGTQRIWYLRKFRGEAFEFGELWNLTRSFFGRFFRLGLICAMLILVPVIIWGAVEWSHHFRKAHPLPWGMTALLLGIGVLIDIALTFVVPALSFSTDSVREALSSGLKMISRTWPASLWYVLAPGLTISFSSLLVSTHTLGGWARPVLWVISGMTAFLLRGTIVPFYLRRNPEVGSDGSAFTRPPKVGILN